MTSTKYGPTSYQNRGHVWLRHLPTPAPQDPGPGHFDPRYSAVTRSAPSIGFGSGSRWREIKRLPKREKGPGPAGPGPGEYNQSTLSGNKMKLGLIEEELIVIDFVSLHRMCF